MCGIIAVPSIFSSTKGKSGEIYNIGGGNEKTNLEITQLILDKLNKKSSMIEYVPDRPGHDFRYSVDSAKIRALGWKPAYSFDQAIDDTISWYQNNPGWWRPLRK